MRDLKALGWGCLAVGMAVTAAPVAAGVAIARDLARKFIRYEQLGEWK